MSIISVSINEKLLKDMDSLSDELGYSGRSEVIRSALRLLISNVKSETISRGNVEAVLVILHNHADISNLKHDFSDIIKTQIHDHISHKCLDLFILSGDQNKVNNLVNILRRNDKVYSVNLIHN